MNKDYSSNPPGKIKGPCVVCGLTDYTLSLGGPAICPACDCGISPKDSRHPINRFGRQLDQPILMPASRDQLILAALNQIAADIHAIRLAVEHKTEP